MTKFAELNAKLDRILALLEERQGVGMSDKDAPVVSYPQPPSVRPEQSVRLVPRHASDSFIAGYVDTAMQVMEAFSPEEYAAWKGVTLSPTWAEEDDPK